MLMQTVRFKFDFMSIFFFVSVSKLFNKHMYNKRNVTTTTTKRMMANDENELASGKTKGDKWNVCFFFPAVWVCVLEGVSGMLFNFLGLHELFFIWIWELSVKMKTYTHEMRHKRVEVREAMMYVWRSIFRANEWLRKTW